MPAAAPELVGTLVAHAVRSIDGVDLSAALLARARARGLYRALHEGDLVASLADHRQSYDAVTAAAVLVHFGDLRPVFAAAAASLRPQGLFVFTLFHNDADEDAVAVGAFDRNLAQTGSYVHGRAYVARLAREAGFAVARLDGAVHDFHHGRPRPGLIVALRRPALP